MEEFINKWQTLIGSALGAFLAVVLSALGFWIKSIISNITARKEFLRRIEISITKSLDSTYKMRQQLEKIVKRIKELSSTVRSVTDNKTFCLNRINFPPVREVYNDMDVSYFKINSYYLHNKLLWIEAGIKEVNEVNFNLKNDFNDLIRQNELLIALIKEGPNPDPSVQRKAYTENLESFVFVIEDYIKNHIQQGVEIMAQIKVYNNYLRKKYGFWFLWKNEGTRFKYFKNKAEQKEFAINLDSLDRIDKIIKKEVNVLIKEMDERSAKLSSK